MYQAHNDMTLTHLCILVPHPRDNVRPEKTWIALSEEGLFELFQQVFSS